MTRRVPLFGPILALIASACEGPLPPETPKTQVDQRASVMPILQSPPAPSGTAMASAAAAGFVFENIGLETPESVLYDAERDLYLVSNIAGSPDGKDGNGFVSRLRPDGTVAELKWLAGGQNGVTLDAPKGSALHGGKLWLSDIDQVRRFDAATGKLEASIAVPGATFLNDVAVAPDGRVFVSDTGVRVGKEGFEPTGADAIYELVKDTPVALAKGTHLGRPNGLAFQGARLLFVNFGGNVLRELDAQGKDVRTVSLPTGGLDGLLALGPDDFIVTSWEGSAIYRGGFLGGFSRVVADQKSPADVGLDGKRQRLLIPVFLENRVRVVELARAPAPAEP